MFDVACKLPGKDGNMFFTLNRQLSGPGDYRPVYKSECKRVVGSSVNWNKVHTDTDTLADADPQKNVMI